MLMPRSIKWKSKMRFIDATPRMNKVSRMPSGPDECKNGTSKLVNNESMIEMKYSIPTPIVKLMIAAWNAGVALMILADQRKYMVPIIQMVPSPACMTMPEYAPS